MGLYNASYPNLELLEYVFIEQIQKLEDWPEKLEACRDKIGTGRFWFNIDVQVFSQVWGSTCTAFDADENGNGVIAGQAMTKAYTTVFHELNTDIYGVFVDNRACYIVEDATDEFLNDLKDHNLYGLKIAGERY